MPFGESWHNTHHAAPTCARPWCARGQVDIFRPADMDLRETRLGIGVRWPTPQRLARVTHSPPALRGTARGGGVEVDLAVGHGNRIAARPVNSC